MIVARRRQLLDEVGIAVGTAPRPVDGMWIGIGAQDRRQLRTHRIAAQPSEVQPLHAGLPGELGEPSVRLGFQVLTPRGEDEQHRLGGEVPGEEGHEVSRRAIDPVDVLEDEQGWPIGCQPSEDREHALLHPRRGQWLIGGGPDFTERRDEARQLRPDGPEHRFQLRPWRGPCQSPERLSQWKERNSAIGEIEAATDQHPSACLVHRHAELRDQPRLPDPRLTGDQDDPRRARRGSVVGTDESRKVILATNDRVVRNRGCGMPRGRVAHVPQRTPG